MTPPHPKSCRTIRGGVPGSFTRKCRPLRCATHRSYRASWSGPSRATFLPFLTSPFPEPPGRVTLSKPDGLLSMFGGLFEPGVESSVRFGTFLVKRKKQNPLLIHSLFFFSTAESRSSPDTSRDSNTLPTAKWGKRNSPVIPRWK